MAFHPDRLLGARSEQELEYPYVVVRVFEAIYERRPVMFLPSGAVRPASDAIVLTHPHPFSEGALVPECRDLLVQHLGRLSSVRGQRMCAVFAPDDAIYVEPDGTIKPSSQPPTGGLSLEGVDLPKRVDVSVDGSTLIALTPDAPRDAGGEGDEKQ